MPLILYVALPDEDLSSTPASALTDDGGSDGWWAGVAQCMVSVGLASVLAANALAAQIAPSTPACGGYQEEQLPVPAAQFSEDVWANPVPSTPFTFVVPAPWNYEQNDIAVPNLYTFDDDPFPLRIPTSDRVVRAFLADDDYYALPIEEQGWTAPTIWPTILPVLNPADDELPAGALHGQFEDDAWSPPPQAPPSSVRAFVADDDYYALPIEEQGWVFPAVWPSTPVTLVWVDTDSASAASVVTDDDTWQNLVTPVPLGFINPVFSSQDDLCSIFDEGEWTAPVLWPVPPPIVFRGGDEDTAGFLHGQFEDDSWLQLVPSVPFGTVVPLQWSYETNDVCPAIQPQQLEHDPWLVLIGPPIPATVVPPQWIYEQNDLVPPGQFADDSLPLALPVPPSTVVPAPWIYEQNERIPVAYDEDGIWTNPVIPTPITFIPFLASANDEISSPVVGLDDSGWTPPIIAEPLRFITSIWFDQDVVVTVPVESDWSNLVAPVPLSFGRLPLFPQSDDVVPTLLFDDGVWQNYVASLPLDFTRRGLGSFGVGGYESVIPSGVLWVIVGHITFSLVNAVLSESLIHAVLAATIADAALSLSTVDAALSESAIQAVLGVTPVDALLSVAAVTAILTPEDS